MGQRETGPVLPVPQRALPPAPRAVRKAQVVRGSVTMGDGHPLGSLPFAAAERGQSRERTCLLLLSSVEGVPASPVPCPSLCF